MAQEHPAVWSARGPELLPPGGLLWLHRPLLMLMHLDFCAIGPARPIGDLHALALELSDGPSAASDLRPPDEALDAAMIARTGEKHAYRYGVRMYMYGVPGLDKTTRTEAAATSGQQPAASAYMEPNMKQTMAKMGGSSPSPPAIRPILAAVLPVS